MNAVIRGAKGALAVAALVGVGLGLRWMTDGAITGMRTYDLESMTVLLVGTVAWMAYGWFVLAVLMTVLEQIPGAIGALAGAVVGRITSKTARTLLRSGLGVAAVTPLTVGAAHATPTDSSTAHVRTQSEPLSTVQLPNTTTWRTTEPGSTVHIAAPAPNAHPQAASSGSTNQRATEPGSQIHLGQAATGYQPKAAPAPATRPEAASSGTTAWRATEPGSQVQLGEAATGGKPEAAPASRPHAASLRPTDQRATHPQAASSGTTARRATEPGSRVHLGQATTGNQPKAAPAPGTHRQAAPADTADWRASEPPSTVRLTEQTPGAGPTQYVGRTDAPNPHTTPPTSERPAATEDAQPDNGVATPAPTGTGRRDGIPTSQPTADARRQDGGPTSQPTAEPRRRDGGRVRVGVPDRPAVGAATRYTDLRSGVPVRVPGSVVVKAGDSLWSLAAAELGPGASAEAVAARWPEWYAANRQVIGSDPDLILPGQVLRIPAAGTGRRVPPTQQEH